jgi:hypothetical protein
MSDQETCPFITEKECRELIQKRNQVEEKTIQVGLILKDADGNPVQFHKRKVTFPIDY